MWRALVFALLAGCAGADAMTAREPASAPAANDLGLSPGEAMTFEVHLAGVLVGEAQLAVGEPGLVGGKQALVVRSRAATAGAAALVKQIADESTTVVDIDTGRPISVESNTVVGTRRIAASAAFEPTQVKLHFQRNDEPVQHVTVDTKQHVLYEGHTAMAQLRGWRASAGATKQVFIVGGRRTWRVDVRYVGPETIGTAVGNRKALVFEGASFRARRDLFVETSKPSRTFRVWLSDDADRVPLKVMAKTELGDIAMNLTEYTRP